MSRRVLLLVTVGLWSCQPVASVGSDAELDVEGDCGVTATTVACPPQPWGASLTGASARARLVGAWAFCGGTRRYTGRGELLGFFGGSGVEFFEEAGGLRFAFLQNGNTARKSGAWANGRVTVDETPERLKVTLTSDDGVAAVWNVALFEGAPALRNDAFDVWNFVAAP